jgi:hypothetical protein
MASKKLILCFDGTWNTMKSRTNVSRLFGAVGDVHAGCADQLKFYDEGVGSTWGEKLQGGVLGLGLDRNILQGYCWLLNNYQPGDPGQTLVDAGDKDQEIFANGDEIFLFGFSRGAFTARSLGGLLNRVGLLKPRPEWRGPATPDTDLVKEAWKLYCQSAPPGVPESRLSPACKEFRQQNSHNVKVKFIGVWDTVGALGIPHLSTSSPFARSRFGFHDAKLGRIVEYAYHAVAIDENREDYNVVLWSHRHALGTKEVRQRWFPGAHANVGGGYEDDLLPAGPLRWLAEMAAKQGLRFNRDIVLAAQPACAVDLPSAFRLDGSEYLSPVRDSYKEFLNGAYALLRKFKGGRFYRRMLVAEDGVSQEVDESARAKWNADLQYRPLNLAHAGRTDSVASAPVGDLTAVTG